MNRLGFLQSCLASATAPYVQTAAGVLMPVRKLIAPDLSERALEDMIIEVMNLTDDRGLYIQLLPTKIVIPNGLSGKIDVVATRDLCEKILAKKRLCLATIGYTTDYR